MCEVLLPMPRAVALSSSSTVEGSSDEEEGAGGLVLAGRRFKCSFELRRRSESSSSSEASLEGWLLPYEGACVIGVGPDAALRGRRRRRRRQSCSSVKPGLFCVWRDVEEEETCEEISIQESVANRGELCMARLWQTRDGSICRYRRCRSVRLMKVSRST